MDLAKEEGVHMAYGLRFTAPFCAILASFVSATPGALAQTSPGATRLEVQGRGEINVVPDLVVISTGVVTQASDAAGAMRENAARITRLLAALQQAGIAARDIQTQAAQLSPQYRYPDNAPPLITGYQAVTSLSVQFRDIKKSGPILDTLVREGANQISGPNFLISDRTAAENKAREAAVRQVQERAALYARAIGLKVGRILSLSETGEAAAPVPMLMVRSASAEMAPKTEIMAGQQQVVITVSAVVELN
jgi:uncharacterized protein YggE